MSRRVIIVDDEANNLKNAGDVLKKDYEVITVASGKAALECMAAVMPDLILLDKDMPDMDGFRVMEIIREKPEFDNVPVIIMDDAMDAASEIRSFELGAADYITKSSYSTGMLKRVEKAIELKELRSSLERQVELKTQELERITLQSITAFANVVDSKDDYTRGHSMRVAEYAMGTARELGWSEEDIKKLHYAAILHDIGRVGVPESVLNKRQMLTESEYNLIKGHVYAGSEILSDLSVVKDLANGAKYHHERYDGKGYPEGLAGEDIPVIARLISVADAFDAMRNPRPYRRALDKDEIRLELESGSGTQFDPALLETFLKVWEDGGFEHVEAEVGRGEESDSSRLLSRIMEKHKENIKDKTERDWLTNLYNRRYAEQAVSRLLETTDGTFFLLDVDNFKQINDVFGHMTGDTVLRLVGSVIAGVIGEHDIAFRLGGDEYGIFVPNMLESEEAAKYAERIIAAYKKKQLDNVYMKKTSLSVGAAISKYDGKTFEELYGKSDKALYFVKQNGRDGFYCYSTDNGEQKRLSALGRKAELQRFADLLKQYREKNGVFEVGYRDFDKVFELASRFTKRNDQKLQLVLFTLLPLDSDFKDAMAQEDVINILEESIQTSLRRVDISVRFSSTQYLVALIDTEQQYISVVTDRIMQSFYMAYKGKEFVIDYDIAKIQ